MPRGNFWEMTFTCEEWAPQPIDFGNDTELNGVTGLASRRIESRPYNKKIEKRHVKNKQFQECDFEINLQTSSFTNCTFHRCRFMKGHWQQVKFSNCKFTFCSFSFVTFSDCDFLDSCQFESNSASAEHLRLNHTAISASAFISAISTNLAHLPLGVDMEYQRHRLTGSKEKLAQAVFTSTRDEANLAFYFQAYKELVLASLRQAVERQRYFLNPSDGQPKKTNAFKFAFVSIPARLELVLANTSGWLTNWGQSVVRAMYFFLTIVVLFSLLYYFSESAANRNMGAACMRALDISLVAGYTTHRSVDGKMSVEMWKIANIVLGIYWYSLVIPTIVRRALR